MGLLSTVENVFCGHTATLMVTVLPLTIKVQKHTDTLPGRKEKPVDGTLAYVFPALFQGRCCSLSL